MKYIADDGMIFDSEFECEDHEIELRAKTVFKGCRYLTKDGRIVKSFRTITDDLDRSDVYHFDTLEQLEEANDIYGIVHNLNDIVDYYDKSNEPLPIDICYNWDTDKWCFIAELEAEYKNKLLELEELKNKLNAGE